jgi:alpha-galactosidase
VQVSEGRRGPVLRNAHLEVACDLAGGSLSLRPAEGGLPTLSRCLALVEAGQPPRIIGSADAGYRQEYEVSTVEDVQGRGRRLTLTSPAGDLTLALHVILYDHLPFVVLQLEARNRGQTPLPIHRLAPLSTPSEGRGRIALGGPPSRWSFYRQGWQSWTPTLSLRAREPDLAAPPPVLGPEPPGRAPVWALPHRPSAEEPGCFLADDLGAVVDLSTGACVVAGFVSARDQLCQVRLDARRRALEAFSWADGVALEPGATVRSERLLVDMAGPPLEALARYGDALGWEMGARVPKAVATGWCSWYRYFHTVREEDILDNLRFLAEHRHELPLEYVQLDDGYSTGIGDWESMNEKFPHGMKWLADRIHDAGFKAGLWLAPFMVGANSALYRQHPDWIIRSASGEPIVAMHNWNQDCYGLDCTHPEAQAWLERLFRTVAEDWGFDYVKVDFVYSAALRGHRHDGRATRAQAYRRGLETIRRAVGERFVLGCGALMAPSVGLVDGQRIGPDVAVWWREPPGTPQPAGRKRHARLPPPEADPPLAEGRQGRAASSFPAVENALRNILTRFWCHRRLWLNDPDCLLARDEVAALTLGEATMPTTLLTLDEVRTLATAIGLSGGMMLDSDNLPALTPERLAIVSLLLPPWGEAALPLDLFESGMPSLFRLPIERPWESWTLLGVFNWDDNASTLKAPLPLGRHHVFDLWSCQYAGILSGEAVFPAVPAHGCKLLALREAQGRPQLVASTFHFTQGALEVEDARYEEGRRTLVLALRPVAKKEGELVLYAPGNLRPGTVDSGVSVTARPDGLWALRLRLERPLRLEAPFVAS